MDTFLHPQSQTITGLSLRAGGLPPPTMSVTLGYFCWKTEENLNQKKPLGV